ncbi:MAG: phosphoribosylformylglycinamidine synthase I [Candidatus Melainabacteria bacterium GWA2_34_9]|nr:MAG: phosphoribosylformylglycinamidine synthase I [Candidatus Melainabacteria bacterium GWA2_34_9]
MKTGIIVFPGTNCDLDTKRACEFFGWETDFIWHDETSLNKYDVVFLPGGFSYGDYIRAGRLARFSPVVMALSDYVNKKRGFLIGICNGFQILCEAKLLPGILSVNDNTKFICEEADLLFENKEITLPIAHGEGRYIADEKTLQEIKSKKMDFLKYKNNPNGSAKDIAGLWDKENNIIGIMPHPERAIFAETGNIDGRAFFEMIEAAIKGKLLSTGKI